MTLALDPAAIENVVVIGMGGSGMAGDVVSAVAAPLLAVPVLVVKSYECPAFVGPESLVFAVSASGDTEETIQAASDAAAAGAHRGRHHRRGPTGGAGVGLGRPADRSARRHPSAPGRARGHGHTATGGAREHGPLPRRSIVDRSRRDPAQASPRRARGGRRRRAAAAAVARRIGRTMALVHGGGSVGATAAQRWKTQINENAKAPAWWSSQPELCHNEVCGWGQHGDVTRQIITAVALRHDAEHPQVGRRFELVGELMREVVADVIEVRAEGDGDLAQLFDLILLGDYVSLWMAAEAGVDPGPVPVLGELKHALSG